MVSSVHPLLVDFRTCGSTCLPLHGQPAARTLRPACWQGQPWHVALQRAARRHPSRVCVNCSPLPPPFHAATLAPGPPLLHASSGTLKGNSCSSLHAMRRVWPCHAPNPARPHDCSSSQAALCPSLRLARAICVQAVQAITASFHGSTRLAFCCANQRPHVGSHGDRNGVGVREEVGAQRCICIPPQNGCQTQHCQRLPDAHSAGLGALLWHQRRVTAE